MSAPPLVHALLRRVSRLRCVVVGCDRRVLALNRRRRLRLVQRPPVAYPGLLVECVRCGAREDDTGGVYDRVTPSGYARGLVSASAKGASADGR